MSVLHVILSIFYSQPVSKSKKKKKKRDYTRLNASVKFRYVKKCILQLFS